MILVVFDISYSFISSISFPSILIYLTSLGLDTLSCMYLLLYCLESPETLFHAFGCG
ncbi:hypothetical protein Syun_002295 [Stephania yunnanensis]|uniref:Uncharacterized protein n=1 Tax=Stephania yunnanensis TaxID=152371 RepID=A0AAP0Q7A5_9MAGN